MVGSRIRIILDFGGNMEMGPGFQEASLEKSGLHQISYHEPGVLCTVVLILMYIHMSFICVYLYNSLIIPTIHIFFQYQCR